MIMMNTLTPAQLDEAVKKKLLQTFTDHPTTKVKLIDKTKDFGMMNSKWELKVKANDYKHFEQFIIASAGELSDYLLFYIKFQWENLVIPKNSSVLRMMGAEATKMQLSFYPINISCQNNHVDAYSLCKQIMKVRLLSDPLLLSFDGFESIKYGFITLKHLEATIINFSKNQNRIQNNGNRNYI